MTTVRDLIVLLIEKPMDDEVFIKDKQGNRIEADICTKPAEGLACLFG